MIKIVTMTHHKINYLKLATLIFIKMKELKFIIESSKNL
jgi:hypothetical protein